MKNYRWKIAQWFERQWWKNYLKGKSPEEYLSWKTNYWKEFLVKLNIYVSDLEEPMIDIGCGPAGIFTIFPKHAILALDPLLEQYEELPIFKQNAYPQVQFISKSFEAYQVNEKFKTIFCLNAINHFIDLNASFEKLGDITASGGKLIISIDAHNHIFFRHLFALLPFDILHPHQYKLEEYVAFVEENGFEVENKVLMKKAFFFDYWVIIARKR